jgi:sulfide:quinone oxidoreductase
MPSGKDRTNVLIAGGGVAALEAMVALKTLAGEHVDVGLLAPDHDFFYRPLSVAEPFGAGEVHRFDLPSLAQGCGAWHALGSLVAVNGEKRSVRTSRGATFSYDLLLVAVGARPREAIPGALTFRGQGDVPAFSALLRDLDEGLVKRVVFALPGGVTWPLPLYELAMLTADRLAAAGNTGAELAIVTPEDLPVALLGGEASSAVQEELDRRGIEVMTGAYPDVFADGRLRLVPGTSVPADRVVSLPRLRGVAIAGLPQDSDFFIPTDGTGLVSGTADVYAAGDITTFPIKQGGLAAQQADAVAEAIAARADAPVTARPFDPVLRGLLLTGSLPLYLRAELGGGRGASSTAVHDALWWPRGKIAARHLAPYFARHAGLAYGAEATRSAS